MFTHHNTTWGKPLYAVRLEGQSGWVEVDGRVISPLEIAGYRTRPDRLAFEADRKKARSIWPRFAGHVAAVFAREFPSLPPVEEVKVYKALVRHTQPEMLEPAGRWRVPPLYALPSKQRPLLAHCRREGAEWRQVVEEAPPSTAAANPTQPGEVPLNPPPIRQLARAAPNKESKPPRIARPAWLRTK